MSPCCSSSDWNPHYFNSQTCLSPIHPTSPNHVTWPWTAWPPPTWTFYCTFISSKSCLNKYWRPHPGLGPWRKCLSCPSWDPQSSMILSASWCSECKVPASIASDLLCCGVSWPHYYSVCRTSCLWTWEWLRPWWGKCRFRSSDASGEYSWLPAIQSWIRLPRLLSLRRGIFLYPLSKCYSSFQLGLCRK